MKIIKANKELQSKFMLISCRSKLVDTLNILYYFVIAEIPFNAHYLFPLIKEHPNYVLTLKIIDKVLNKSDITMWKWLCYFSYCNNFKVTFFHIYKKKYGTLDTDTIQFLYKGYHMVDVDITFDKYSLKLKKLKKEGESINSNHK